MLNVVTTQAPTFLIGSSSYMQVIRTAIKSWMGRKLGKMESETVELAALEPLENSFRLIMGEML